MLMYGGSGPRSHAMAIAGAQPSTLWALDLRTFKWEVVQQQKGQVPLPRDDHTAVVFDGRDMIVFGGFVDGGERTNETYIYSIKDNKWERIEAGRVLLLLISDR